MNEADAVGRDGSAGATPPILPTQAASPLLALLRATALVGVAVLLLWNCSSLFSMEPRQEWSFLVMLPLGIAVTAACLVPFRAATWTLWRHPDLLLPLALYLVALTAWSIVLWMPGLGAVVGLSWTMRLPGTTLPFSLTVLLYVVLGWFVAGWTTVMVVQAVREDRVDPAAALAAWPTWFPPVLVAGAIGWAVAIFVAVPAMLLIAVFPVLGLSMLAVVSLAWNMMTAPVLPLVVAERGPLAATLRRALDIGIRRWRRWWFPVLLQLVLLGWLTVFSITLVDYPAPGEVTTTTRERFNVNTFWVGGYQNNCEWLDDLMNVVEATPLSLVAFLLGLLFTIFAIVVKIRVTASLLDPVSAGPAVVPDTVDLPGRPPVGAEGARTEGLI